MPRGRNKATRRGGERKKTLAKPIKLGSLSPITNAEASEPVPKRRKNPFDPFKAT